MAVGDRQAQAGSGWAQLFSVQSLSMLLGIAAAAAAIAAVWFWSRTPDYRVLYGNLTDRDGGAVVAALQQMNVPYRIGEGGSVQVPNAQVHEVRLRLAGQGLPRGGTEGFELLENSRMGTSQFLEQVNYQRALEGELVRSIQTLSAVRAARVHLALSRPSVFVREQHAPTASVVLSLNPGRTLDAAQVNAIANLVASSVPDLPAKRVTVLDQSGNLLSASGEGTLAHGLDSSQLKYVRSIESDLAHRVEAILTPIVGQGNVHAQVSADVDFSVVERAEEEYKPNQGPQAAATVRSQQTSETVSPTGAQASGVPGALSNQPPAPAAAPIVGSAPKPAATAPGQAPAAAPMNTHKDATTNYEVDRTIRHIRQPVGSVRRLSAAVVVNQRKQAGAGGAAAYKPLGDDEMKQITELAREAMGFDEKRGDSLNVVNRPFSEPEPVEAPEVPLWKDPAIIEPLKSVGRTLLFAALAAYVFFAFLRPTYRRLTAPPPALPAPALPDAQAGALPGLGPRSYQGNLDAARQVAQQEPRLVANVVKAWVGGNE